MKILFLITGLGVGGAEKVVVGLADSLSKEGHEVAIVYMAGSAAVIPVDSKLKVIALGIKSKISGVFAVLKLRSIIRAFKPDVVHSHMVHANILARLTRLFTPMALLICTAHSSNEGGELRMLAYRVTDWLADLSTNVSEDAVAAFILAKAAKPGRMVAVHNGIATDTFFFNAESRVKLRQSLCINENCRLILAVGRLQDAKDYDNLFHAFAKLPEYDFKLQLCIAGDGPLRSNLEALGRSLGIADRVHFLGIRHDVADLMSAADIFVLSSAWEGFGLVVAEAMACERVIVATDCGGVREVVGDAGYLVKPQDSSALAKALDSALQLTISQGASLGHSARQRVLEKYSLNSAVDKWLGIYASNGK